MKINGLFIDNDDRKTLFELKGKESGEVTSHTKEYRGEKIEAGLTARLIPSGAQHSDSFCRLILTERHLYILEGNYNGTHNELYALFIERIQDMEAQVKGLRYKRSVLGEMFSNGILSLFGGALYAPEKKKEDNGTRFVIIYDDGMGKCNQLYFKDLQTNSNHIVKVYYMLKKFFDKTIMR